MKDTKGLQGRLIDYIFGLLLGWCMTYALTKALNLPYHPISVIGLLGGILLLLNLIFINKLSIALSAGAMVAVPFVGLLMAWRSRVPAVPFWNVLTEVFVRLSGDAIKATQWLISYINLQSPLERGYGWMTLVFLCILFSILVAILNRFDFPFIVIMIGGMSLFITQWILDFFSSYTAFVVYLVLLLGSYLRQVRRTSVKWARPKEAVSYSGISHLHNHSSDGKVLDVPAQPEHRPAGLTPAPDSGQAWFTLFSMPVVLLVVLISVILPDSDKPIQWPWLDDRIAVLARSVEGIATNEYFKYDTFSLYDAGFGDWSGKLGGRVREDDTVVMIVDAPRPVYLRGATRDAYDGNSWQSTEKGTTVLGGDEDYIYHETEEMLMGAALVSRNQNYVNQFFYEDYLTVIFQSIRTKSIFAPIGTVGLEFPGATNAEAMGVTVDGNLTVVMDKARSQDFYYGIQSLSPQLGAEGFTNLLRKSYRGYYDALINSAQINARRNRFQSSDNFPVANVDRIGLVRIGDLKELSQNSKRIYDMYLRMPAEFPERVKDLSKELVKDNSTDYDKVKTIERYLSSGFSYTLTPPAPPKGADFVDFFLFRAKEGYCVHFATAMTMMVRSIGIPARYVEGYAMPGAPSEGGSYAISNDRAHAWTEVYFEGIGWIPFEPTASFMEAFYTTQKPTEADPEMPSLSDGADDVQQETEVAPAEEGTVDAFEALAEDAVEEVAGSRVSVLRMVLLALVVLFFGTIGIQWFKGSLRSWRMRRLGPRDGILHHYRYYVKMFALHGLRPEPWESPMQFSQRVDSSIAFGRGSFREVTDQFESARYGSDPVKEENYLTVKSFEEEVIHSLKRALGLKYYICRYLLGRI